MRVNVEREGEVIYRSATMVSNDNKSFTVNTNGATVTHFYGESFGNYGWYSIEPEDR